MKIQRHLPDAKSQCGCNKADELIHRFNIIDVSEEYPARKPEEKEVIFSIVVGKTLNGYSIYEPIKYCPYCGNRFDGAVAK